MSYKRGTKVVIAGVEHDMAQLDLGPLKAACDRDWKDETPQQVIAIAANAIYWRDREIALLNTKLDDLGQRRGHKADEPCTAPSCYMKCKGGVLDAWYPGSGEQMTCVFLEPSPQPASQPVGELCRDCGNGKNDARFHLDAPGDNWGAALHWFKLQPASGEEGK